MKELEKLKELDKEARLTAHIGSVLSWDQETYMPSDAVDERSEQLALIETLVHEKSTNKEIDQLLKALGSTSENPKGDESLPIIDRAYLRVLRRQYDQSTKLPASHITEMAKLLSLSQSAWVKAKRSNDWKSFAPLLEKVINLQKNTAAYLNPNLKPYDVLLDTYEVGASEAQIANIFSGLRKDLVSLLDKIMGKAQVDDSFFHQHCPATKQEELSKYFMNAMSYDFGKGRLDIVEHPFTTTLGENDIRITTKYDEEFFPSSLFSTIHESGHALYEMGMKPSPAYLRTSLADACSTAVHESQSRLWENIIGRSFGFWLNHLPATKKILSIIDDVPIEKFYKAINKVEPSFVRTEADEVTYSLHIILRFELESKLISGEMSVNDIPDAWNKAMKEMFGITPKNDTEGCLQDVHWSMGYFGYFPGYALGNLYGAQWWDQMKKEGQDPNELVNKGNLAAILAWFRKNVHEKGAIYTPSELIEHTTGHALDASHFVNYLNEKYKGVYGF